MGKRLLKSNIIFVTLILFLPFFLPAFLHAHDNIQVHPYIAEQAFLIWPKDTSHEIYQYLGYGYRDELGGNNPLTVPIACGNATVGNIITEGAKEEDDYDPVGEVCTIEPDPFAVGFDLTYGYNHHFYNPDINSYNNGQAGSRDELQDKNYEHIQQFIQ